jgi:hypothetical protein
MPRLLSPALAALLLLSGCSTDQAAKADPGAGTAQAAGALPAPAVSPAPAAIAAPAASPAAAASSAANALADAGKGSAAEAGFVSLFNGNDLAGWEGNLQVWRVEDHVIVGGSLQGNPRNEFLATTASYGDFVFTCEYKLTGTEGFINSGVQLRSQRVKQPANEMTGYQADIGVGYTGSLYDESRRNKTIAKPDPAQIKRLDHLGDWNRYEVRAEGRHIVITLNGEVTVDYTEADLTLPQEGFFGLQIHGGAKSEVRFRNLRIKQLPPAK